VPNPRRPSEHQTVSQHSVASGIIDEVSSSGFDHLARTAYEAHREAQPRPLPPWEEVAEEEQQAWRVAVSAVAAQTGSTIVETVAPNRSLLIQAGDQRHAFHTNFVTGRQGNLAITDEFASSRHARFQIAHGLWYVEDLGSTNGTWLNGRRIHAPQRLKKGDKIRIGHTVMIVVSS
jgi:pSer/pThr/pTyr-binding forkhead associated (FHA) protein